MNLSGNVNRPAKFPENKIREIIGGPKTRIVTKMIRVTPVIGDLQELESGLLAEDGLSDGQTEFVRLIQASANNLLDIINDILDLSKIESGKMTIERVEAAITQILDQVREQRQRVAEIEKEIEQSRKS